MLFFGGGGEGGGGAQGFGVGRLWVGGLQKRSTPVMSHGGDSGSK